MSLKGSAMKDLWRKLRRGQQPQEQEPAPQFPPNTDAELIRLESIYQGRQRARSHSPYVDRSGHNIPHDARGTSQRSSLLAQLAEEGYTQRYLDEIAYR